MARLIDYHTNCGCGADVHIAADIISVYDDGDGPPQLRIESTTSGSHVGQCADLPNDLASVVLADGSLYTDHPRTDSLDRTDNSLDRALATVTTLTAAATWVVEQAEAGENIDLDEVRTRFGLDAPDDSQHDTTTGPPSTPPDAAAATTAPARPRPGRKGGG